MKKRRILTSVLTAMAIVPSIIDNTDDVKRDAIRAGKKSSRKVMNKIDGRRTAAMIVTGLSGYFIAHAAPIKGLIRDE